MGQIGASDLAPRLVGRPGPQITLAWDNPANLTPGTITEVWASPDLQNWTLATNAAAPPITLPADLPAQFFKIRNRDADGLLSDWSKKTN